jgi:transposase-like protein
MQFQISEAYCPRCRKPVTIATIEPHPTRADIAHHNYQCEDCGPVLTRAVSLKAGKSLPSQTA